jgi:BolA protein
MPTLNTALLEKILFEHFSPLKVEVLDQTSQHLGHKGAPEGSGHFEVTLVSSLFEGKTKIEQHRLVYSVLQSYFGESLHALALRTYSPTEWGEKDG